MQFIMLARRILYLLGACRFCLVAADTHSKPAREIPPISQVINNTAVHFYRLSKITSLRGKTGSNCADCKESRDKHVCAGWENHFDGGLCTNSTPFAMFPRRPSVQAWSSFFSYALTWGNGFCADSAPDGPSSTGIEK